jgi:hypothetical protein
MDPNIPSSYKNYLPSKKIQVLIIVLLLILIGYFTVPKLITVVKNKINGTSPKTTITTTVPVGDPTTRDSDSDGVPDWQEILVGLDPHKSSTKNNIPDLQAYETLKAKIGVTTFNNELNQVDDTDKVSLTIYNTLAQDSIKNNGISVEGTQQVTTQELYNYIDAQRKTITTYGESDLTVVQGTLEENKAYAQVLSKTIVDTADTKDASSKIKQYLDNSLPRSSINSILTVMQDRITRLKAAEVPRSALATHLELLNGLQGLYQVLSTYDPETTDSLQQLGSVSLVQDYLIQSSKAISMLAVYLSLALDTQSYSQSQ